MLILWLMLTELALASLSFLNTTMNPHQNAGSLLTQIRVQKQFLINFEYSSSSQQNPTYNIITYFTLNSAPVQYSFNMNMSDGTPAIRSTPLTTSPTNSTFVTFVPGSVRIHRNFDSSLMFQLDFSVFGSVIICDVCIGASLTQFYVLANVYSNSVYSMIIFNNSNTYQSLNNITINANAFDKMICRYNKIHISFLNQIIILAMNSSVTPIISIPCVAGSPILFDFDIHDNNLLAYNNQTMLFIVNVTDGNIIDINYIPSSASCVSFVSQSVVVYANMSDLMQYNFINHINMNSITLTDTSSNYRIFVTGNMIIQMFDTVLSPFFTYSSNYYIFDLNYSCSGCSNCSTGHTLDVATSTCMPTNSTINSTLNITNTSTNGSALINNTSATTNSSNATSNPTNSTNSTTNTTTNLSSKAMSVNFSSTSESSPQSQHSSSSIDNDIFSFFQQLSSYDNMQLSHFMSSMMIISSIKFSPQFLLSFSLFIDDISYYSYHSYTYPNSVRYFFQKSFVFLKDKLNPWLLKAIQLLSRPTDYALANNNRNIQLLSIPTLTNQQVFLTRSFIENYRNNFIFTISIFLFLYIVRLLINVLQYCGCNLSKAKSFIIRNTRWWVLYASLVQGSISQICFDFGVQLQQPGLQTALDGFNLIITYIIGFIVLAQIFIVYALIYYWASRKQAKVMLMPCRYSSFSFVFQPIIIVGRTSLCSFLHSFLLTSYSSQILMLTIVDFSVVILCFKMRALFYNRTIFAFYFIYMLSFAVFDLFFLLEQSGILSSLQVMRQLFGVTILGCIISASIFIFLVFTYLFLRVTLRSILRYLFVQSPRLRNVPQSQFTKKCAQRTEQNPNHQKLQKIQKIDNNFAKWLEHGKIQSNAKQQNLSTPVLLCGRVKNRNKIQQRQKRKVKFRLHKLSNMKLLSNAQQQFIFFLLLLIFRTSLQ